MGGGNGQLSAQPGGRNCFLPPFFPTAKQGVVFSDCLANLSFGIITIHLFLSLQTLHFTITEMK